LRRLFRVAAINGVSGGMKPKLRIVRKANPPSRNDPREDGAGGIAFSVETDFVSRRTDGLIVLQIGADDPAAVRFNDDKSVCGCRPKKKGTREDARKKFHVVSS